MNLGSNDNKISSFGWKSSNDKYAEPLSKLQDIVHVFSEEESYIDKF